MIVSLFKKLLRLIETFLFLQRNFGSSNNFLSLVNLNFAIENSYSLSIESSFSIRVVFIRFNSSISV